MTAPRTMFDKIWDAHVVTEGPSPGATMTVDLESQTITAPDGSTHPFDIDPSRKQALLTGQDEIALTLTHEPAIAAFEARRRADAPWLFA